MLPSEYGLSAYSPESYVAIAVEDLIEKAGKEAIHAAGVPSKEYLGMLALYAIRRSTLLLSDEKQTGSKIFKLANETFDPFNMRDNLTNHTFASASHVYKVRNLWTHKDEAASDKVRKVVIPAHDVVVYRLSY